MNITIVGGGGHVGLPLGLICAKNGISVNAFDTDKKIVDEITLGNVPFLERGAEDLLRDVIEGGFFRASSDPESIRESDIVIIVIGTPVDEFLQPNPNTVIDVVSELIKYMNKDQLIILRSTIFPGVTKRIEKMLEHAHPSIGVAYCPERIVEGNALEELENLPQIIGSTSKRVFDRASKLFETIGVKTIHTSPEEAELSKLFTNVWRYIKFATANQFWMIANDLEVDYENVRKAISFEYPRAADLPKPGFTAGPCLFKDTMQLSALTNQKFILGHAAMLINEGTPSYIIEKLKNKFDLKSMRVGILGMAFKGEVDDIRGSLAFKLRRLLAFECKEVLATDEYASDIRFESFNSVIEKADILIIGAPHIKYKTIQTEKPIIDIWNLYDKGVLL